MPKGCTQKCGFSCEYFDCKGAEAYLLENKYEIILACRGTEPGEMQDIIHDIKVKLVPSSSQIGKVHMGFKEALDKIWPNVVEKIKKSRGVKKVYFTGHSLGAAMATLAAVRTSRLSFFPKVEGLYTFGSPKVGNSKYIRFMNELSIPHVRWVNNIDIVTRVPLWPYKHHSKAYYMNHDGVIKNLNILQTFIDRIKGAITGLQRGKINYFVNHGSEKYINNIQKNIDKINLT
jgi:triacylglycerol lipase